MRNAKSNFAVLGLDGSGYQSKSFGRVRLTQV